MMNGKLAMVLLLLLGLPGEAAEPARSTEVHLSLQQAVAEGKVDLEIRSLGRSTGPCMKLVIKRRVPQRLRLTIDSGLVFKSRSGKVQDMVAAKVLGEYRASDNTYRPDGLMILRDDRTHEFVLEAYCLDSHKPTPGLREGFLLGGLDVKVRGILELGMSRDASTSDLQMAIWIDRPMAAGVTIEGLMSRVGATAANVQAARSLLAQLEIDGLPRWVGSLAINRPAVAPPGAPAGEGVRIQTEIRGLVPPIGPVRVVEAKACPRVEITGPSGQVETRAAAEGKRLLVLHVAVVAPRFAVVAEDFQVRVDGQAIPAFALAPSSGPMDADRVPRFDPRPATPRPRRFRRLRRLWQLGFEIPEGATQGTLVWRHLVGVDWQVPQ